MEKAKEEQKIAERKKKNIKFKRICQEWSLEAIVNRYHNQEDAWNLEEVMKGGHRDLLICKRWKVVRTNDDGKEVDEDGNEVP